MIYAILQKCKYFFGGAFIVAHLLTCFLSPWFHQHVGEDHAEVKGDVYHSHVSPFASHGRESEQDHHDLAGVFHLLEGSQPVEKMKVAIAVQIGQISTIGKFAPHIDFFFSPFVAKSPPGFVVKTFLKLPPIQPAREYFALTAAGLSPPLA